ncbi:MAG TPA: BrnA antitoxin family protein [Ancylobacter sp.]
MTSKKPMKEFEPGHGYTRQDWNEVSDNPEMTEEDIRNAKPFADAFPALAESIKRSRGRPKVESPKEAVTLRLSPETVARFKAAGAKDWRARMSEVIEKAIK